jgi:general secretion pathway protein N
MKAFIVAIAAAVIVVVALAAFAPASLVDARIASATAGTLRIAEAGGTLWRGRGVLGASDGRWRIPIAWSVDVATLPRGVASIALGNDEAPEVRGQVIAARDRIVVESLDATLPGALLGALDPQATLATGGEVKLRATALALDRSANIDASSGAISAEWSNARAQFGELRIALGTVTLRLATQGDALSGPLASQGGDVVVDGTVTLRDQRLDAQLRLTPSPAASPELRNTLGSLGAADAQGAVALRIGRTLR